MGICSTKATAPPLPSEETSEAVCMIERQESQMLAARVRSFPVNLLWKRYKSTMVRSEFERRRSSTLVHKNKDLLSLNSPRRCSEKELRVL